MNWLKKRIGIFYKTDDWLQKILPDIYNHLPPDSYRAVRKNLVIELKDGTTIEFIDNNSFCERGRRFDEIYAEEGISEKEVNWLYANLWPDGKVVTIKNGYDIFNHIDRRRVKEDG